MSLEEIQSAPTHTGAHAHTLTWESQSSLSLDDFKGWIRWKMYKEASASVHDSDIYFPPQPSVQPMRRGLLHQGWYWVLVFLVTTPTAKPAPGCYTWFQVSVMWPLEAPNAVNALMFPGITTTECIKLLYTNKNTSKNKSTIKGSFF